MPAAKNPAPLFKAPSHHKPRPAFQKKCINYARTKDLGCWEGFYLLDKAAIGRKQRFKKVLRDCMQQVAIAMLHYVNVADLTVRASVERLSNDCGMTTTSKAGNISISRASRLIKLLEKLGFIKTENFRPPNSRHYLPKFIMLTARFFLWIGIREDELLNAQNQANQNLSARPDKATLIKRHFNNALSAREQQLKIAKWKLLGQKLSGLSLDQKRQQIAKRLVQQNGRDAYPSVEKLIIAVSQKLSYIEKLLK